MKEDLEKLLQAVSEAQPAGTDLEYEPDFARMEKASQGSPEQEIGSTVVEAQPPDWEEVLELARSLLTRSKDLRIASQYAQARLVMEGLPGFCEGLELLAGLVERYWDTLFPQLDADEDNDPTMRINALLNLNNAGGVVRQLRETPIVSSRSVGRFSLVDVGIARGELPVPAGMENPPTQKKLDATVQSSDPAELGRLHEAVEKCLRSTAAIEEGFAEHLAFGAAPNFELLTKELKNISRLQRGWLDKIRPSQVDQPQESGGDERAASPISGAASSSGVQAGVQIRGGVLTIQRREDALECLDKIIQWFERYEPSSPLPMLLKRAKRLATLSFLEILRDISPEGLNQAVLVGGCNAADLESEAGPPAKSEAVTQSPTKSSPPPDDKY